MGKIRQTDLIGDFRRMLLERWAYVGGAAEEGKVDCSGAFVFAYRQHGKSIAHGSNRIARTAVGALLPVSAARPGMAAFKAREPGEDHYDLPDEYRPGGKYCDGDLNDYYHIGLVDEDGAHVLNARSTADGFVSSPIADGWDCAAYLTDVEYDIDPRPEPQGDQYRVVGGRLNLRERPSKKAPAVRSLAEGEIVKRLADAGEWMQVKAGRETGYALKEYLEPVGGSDGGSGGEDEEYIIVPKSAWEALKKAFDVFEDASVAAGVIEDE